MVECIEEFGSELHIEAFLFKVFRQHEIPIVRSRPVEIVSWSISKAASWRDRKCRWIQVDSLAGSIMDNRIDGCANHIKIDDIRDIRPVARRSRVAVLVGWAQLNEDRPAGLKGGDTGKLPATEQHIESGSPVSSECFLTAEGQLVDIAQNKPLPRIEIRTAAVRFQISCVLSDIAAGGVIDRMTIRV